jgi:hypothetical protein
MAVSRLAAAYLPMDRRLALLDRTALPEWSQGAVLFADLRGFTALGEALALSREALAALQAAEIAVNWEHQVHYNHYFICRAQGLDDEDRAALEQAYRVMRALAEVMAPGPRQALLERVRVNQEIAQAWLGLQKARDPGRLPG